MAIAKQSDDFPQWYQSVVKDAELAEPSFVRGTYVIKPYGYSIWESVQQYLDKKIKAEGVENLYFPLFIPERLINKEKGHIEGFAPEIASVTHAGGKKLEEPLIVRPTSEAIIWETFSKWIQSYRDLPLQCNQWANVVRWEMRPRVFLRSTEFLWQEGHTAHQDAKEARNMTKGMLDVYQKMAHDVLAMPVQPGRKSPSERFPGADETFTIEGLMRDGKALQAATSHDLGQNFAKTYDVQFANKQNEQEFAYATSWGMSTRIIGGIIMTHGDDKGLRIPPKIAPIQVVIVPIHKSPEEQVAVEEVVKKIKKQLSKFRVRVDDRDQSPGYKFNEWERKGVPLRIEVGPKDIAVNQVSFYRRDTGAKGEAVMDHLDETVGRFLDQIQDQLLEDACAFLKSHTHHPATYSGMKRLLEKPSGFVQAGWCGDEKCEQKVKKETKATIRYLAGLDTPEPADSECGVCGKPAKETAFWAQAY